MTTHASGSPLRIALFTFSYAPFMTGIAIGTHCRAKQLLERGHSVMLIHPEADAQYPPEIRNRQMPGLDELRQFPRFSSATYPTRPDLVSRSHPEPRSYRYWSDSALLENYRPDVILVEEAAGMRGFSSVFLGGYGKPVGVAYARRHGIPAIVMFETDFLCYAEEYFGKFLVRMSKPFLRPQIRKFSESYDCTFFPSRVQQEKYRPLGIAPSEHVVFHGVDCELYSPENSQHDPIPDDKRTSLLFVGRVAREKNVLQLFDSFRIVQKTLPDAHLAIVGGGPALAEVRRAAIPFGDSVTVWGESFGAELKGWYARADLFLNPSISENFCTTNLESLASGTPIVAARAGGNSEQVRDGVNGFLSAPNQPADMAEKALRILADRSFLAKMSHGARESALEFDIRACADRLEGAMLRLIAASPSVAEAKNETRQPEPVRDAIPVPGQ